MKRTPEGIGVGLRIEFAAALLADDSAPVSFVEIHPENFVHRGGAHTSMLARARDRFPLITHGLTYGFANAEAPGDVALASLAGFLADVDAALHSDHLCFASSAGRFAHELLPPPLDARTVELATERMRAMRDAIGRPVAVENVSYYVPRARDPLAEIEVIRELLERTDGLLLLDVNNVVVNAHNHGFDPRAWLARVPYERVGQIHVAGHFIRPDGLRIDTHGSTTDAEVRALLGEVLERTGPVPVLLERDAEMPPYAELREELDALRRIYDDAMERRANASSAPRTWELRTSADRADLPDPRTGEPEDASALQHAILDHLLAPEPAKLGEGHVAHRWALYRHMAQGRLRDLLFSVYARTRARLATPDFDALLHSWLHPGGPRTRVFWLLGEEFGEHALGRPELADRRLQDLLRLERAEWRIRQAPYPATPAPAPLTFDRPALLTSALELVDVEHAWHDVGPGDAADPRPEASLLAVYRRLDDTPGVLSLNPLAAALLHALRAPHASIAAALQQVARDRDLAVTPALLESIATTFAQWHELGLLLGTRPT